MTHGERLLGLVRGVRRRALALGLARVILAFVAGLGAGPLMSVAALPWAPPAWRPWVAVGCLAAGAATGLVFAFGQWQAARPLLPESEAARLLAEASPNLRSLIHTGADLAAWGEDGALTRRVSTDLVEAQVEVAATAAAEIDRRRVLPLRPAAGPAAGFAAILVLLAAGYAADPWKSLEAWRDLLAQKPLAAVAVGNLRIRYEPPAYSGLSASAAEGASGAVEGLRGTRVTLEGELSASADSGRWEDTNGRKAALEVAERTFRVSWILERSGSYTLSFERRSRTLPSDFQAQTMTLRDDRRPTVELGSPEGDLEVRTDAEVEVRFSASDDFRVDRVEIVLQGDSEVRLPVKISAGKSVEGSARILPMAHPKLGAGANLRVEAWDSDSVSGPKSGASRSIYLTFLDKKKLLADIEGLEERLLEALLVHLADHLELATPKPGDLASLRGKAGDVLKLFAALADRVRKGAEEGALGATAVLRLEEGLRAGLEPFVGGSDDRRPLIAELERDVLLLDRLLRNLRMEETLSLADQISALQRGLFDRLAAGADPRELSSQLEEIERQLARMMEKLGHAASEMPDAFANADAVRDAPSSELRDTLAKLRKALQEGNREAAKKLAEELLDILSRWAKALEEAAEGAAGREMSPLSRELAQLESEVRTLAGEQERLLGETRSLGDQASRKSAETLRGELLSFLQRQEMRLNHIADYARRLEAEAPRRSFPSPGPAPAPPQAPPLAGAADLFETSRRVSSAISDVRRALREDLGRARSGAEALGEAFEALRDQVMRQIEAAEGRREVAGRYGAAGLQEIGSLQEDLAALGRLRMRALGPREQQALRELGSDQGRLGERTENLAEKLENVARRTPFVGPGLPRRARSSRDSMGAAGERLGQGDPSGALPPEGDALEGLSEIARDLEGARRQMQQGRGPGGFRTLPSPGASGGGREMDRSRVEIPKEAEARELKAFREEVLKAMRRGQYPKDYEEEVEKYYERLIR